MNRLLARRVQEAEFGTVRLRTGYDTEEVDDFLDELAEQLLEGGRVTELLDRRFRRVRWRLGYVIAEVDDLLRDIREAWQPPAEPAPGSDPALVARLHDIRFRPVRERDAYAMRPVDQLLDDLESAATGGDSLQALLDSVAFATVQKRQQGYPHTGVDDFLASLGRHAPGIATEGAVISSPSGRARRFGRH